MKSLSKNLVLSMVLICLLAVTWLTPANQWVDAKADAHLVQVWERSLFTFTIARGINGVISVLQGTEVTLSLFGTAGTKVAIGQVLDPVNDLIEIFSSLMLLSSASIGLQRFCLPMGTWLGFKLLLSVAVPLLLAGIWLKSGYSGLRGWGYRLLMLALIARFFIPAAAWTSAAVYEKFLAKYYTASMSSLEQAEKELKFPLLNGKNVEAEQGVWATLREAYEKSKDLGGVWRWFAIAKEALGDYARFVIDLLLVFFIQTMLIPLVVLWLVMGFFKGVFLDYLPRKIL
jgi:hypothetical protein